MAKKREEEPFVVTDRRKFSAEGDRLSNAPPDEVETAEEQKPAAQEPDKPAAEVALPPPAPPAAVPEQSAASPAEDEIPAPPSAAEQSAQSASYSAMGKKIDDMIDQAGGKRPAGDFNFESLINSLSMQAMMQLGVLREEGAPMRPDVIGARGTIDILSLLAEKTKGNLTDRESKMLQSVLFELRMAFLEITNVMTQPPPPGQGPLDPNLKK